MKTSTPKATDRSGNPMQPSRRDVAALSLGGGLAIGAGAIMADAASAATTGKRRPSAETRLDILDLFARYSWNYDCSNVDGAAACFTEDAVLDALGEEIRGRDAIRALIANIFETVRGDVSWQHHNAHFIIEGDDEACSVYCYTVILERAPNMKDYGVHNFGYYHSECRKVDGEWLIAKRSINRWNRDQLPWNA